jgi:hypothetical protein
VLLYLYIHKRRDFDHVNFPYLHIGILTCTTTVFLNRPITIYPFAIYQFILMFEPALFSFDAARDHEHLCRTMAAFTYLGVSSSLLGVVV